MCESADKSIILTFDEIRILLYSQGFRTCEGIYMPEKEYTAKEILRAMHHMAKRGLFITHPGHDLDEYAGTMTDDGKGQSFKQEENSLFRLKPDLQRMIRAMGASAGTFVFRPGEAVAGFQEELYNGKEYFCYTLPDYYLVAERDWTRHESIRLRTMDTQAFLSWKEEREQEEIDKNSIERLSGAGTGLSDDQFTDKEQEQIRKPADDNGGEGTVPGGSSQEETEFPSLEAIL